MVSVIIRNVKPPALLVITSLAGTFLPQLYAEEYIAHPHAPEPMVFDLVRPLGVRRGELEINTLGIVPFRRTTSSVEGLFPSSEGTEEDPPATKRRGPGIEWAPEIEFAPLNNFALEFELPFADGTLAEYKAGAQWSFSPTANGLFIDGIQGLLNIDADGSSVTPTLLYL